MKKIIAIFLAAIGIITITSCASVDTYSSNEISTSKIETSTSNVETYSLKEAGGFEISNITSAIASKSVYQSSAWPVLEEAYQYLDCEYIKVDFDIQNEFWPESDWPESDWPQSELKDDAYVLHVDIKDVDIYEDYGPIFCISHNNKYMYFDGIDGTYRSKEKAPSRLIELINCEPIPPTGQFKLTIIDNHNYIFDEPEQLYFTPFTEIKLHSYPIMDVDLAMYVNGEFYTKQTSIETDEGYIWEYTYTMPINDVTLEFKVESVGYSGTVLLSDLYPWINEIQLTDIESVLYYSDLGSIAPTYRILNSYYIGNEKTREETYDFLKNTVVTISDDPYWDGVGVNSLIVKLKNGSTYTLSHIRNGFYVGDQYFIYSTFPSFFNYYANSFLYQCSFSLFKGDNLVKDDVSEMRKIIFTNCCDDDYVQQEKFAPYTIRMEEEKIYIVDYRTFYIISNNEKNYFQILNDFSFDCIINED